MKKIIIFCISLIILQSSYSGVNVNNGNFHIAYSDFVFGASGINLPITRTYNSRSNYVRGYFGVGWSSNLESYLKFKGKDIVWYQGGGGNVVRFKDKGKYWLSTLMGSQRIKKDKDLYSLEQSDGSFLMFNKKGQLVKFKDQQGNFVQLVYKKGLLTQIKDNKNTQTQIKVSEINGFYRVSRLEGGAKVATFQYDKLGNLIEARGADSVRYTYSYDKEHNLTKIGYSDGDYKELKYNKEKDWVVYFRDRGGYVTEYKYFTDKVDPENKFGTILTSYKQGSKKKVKSRFWYEFKRNEQGKRYNHRSVTAVDGEVKENIFTECCGTPLMISTWYDSSIDKKPMFNRKWTRSSGPKKTTRFQYYADGLLKSKLSNGGVLTKLKYDKNHRKIASVNRNGKKVSFKYDSVGNLSRAIDYNTGRDLSVKFNGSGQIITLKEKEFSKSPKNSQLKKTIYFRYNGSGLPIEIKEVSGKSSGSINIGYHANGAIKGIFNSKGNAFTSLKEKESAQRIAMGFQSLLDVVQPRGIGLNP